MKGIKNFLSLTVGFRKGYKINDKIKILFHNMLYVAFYPVNWFSFLFLKRNLLNPRVFFSGFKVKNLDGLFVCRDNVDIDIVSETFEHGIRKYFKDFQKGVFVDIGANIGKYTIMVGNQLKKGKIISIEPHPENFEILKKNIELNRCENVIPINIACWNKKDALKLFSHENQPLLASAVKQSKNYITVSSEPLDEILENMGMKDVDLVKIDAEGAEPKVLEGMKGILESGKAKIIFEAWDDEYLNASKAVLERYGYQVERLDDMYWIGFRKSS